MVRHVDLVMERRETNKPNGMTERTDTDGGLYKELSVWILYIERWTL